MTHMTLHNQERKARTYLTSSLKAYRNPEVLYENEYPQRSNLIIPQINNIYTQKKIIQITFEHSPLTICSICRIYSMDKKSFKEILKFI